MLTFEEAQQALNNLPRLIKIETIPLAQAYGRIAAEDICLEKDQPSFDRSTMDGYAVHLDGDTESFQVIGVVLAGSSFDGTVETGQAVRIMTGAPTPTRCTVIPVECTDNGDEVVTITERNRLQPGKNIAWQGEDGHAGDIIVQTGTRLGPATLASAAMAGAKNIQAYTQPTLALVTTGDEVFNESAAGINDSNGPFLEGFCAALHIPFLRFHARDDEEHLRTTLQEAAEQADIVVTTGGVSAGTRDLVPATAAACGFTQVFHKVAIQPGKPVLLCHRTHDHTFFVGLPGNPVSVLATAHLFLLPVIQRFTPQITDAWIPLPIHADYSHTGKRRLFLPAVFSNGTVTPIQWNGSGDLFAAAAATGLIDLQPGANYAAGDCINYLPYIGTDFNQTGIIPPRERT